MNTDFWRDIDNLVALVLVGVIAILALVTKQPQNHIVDIALGGMLGYTAKGVIRR